MHTCAGCGHPRSRRWEGGEGREGGRGGLLLGASHSLHQRTPPAAATPPSYGRRTERLSDLPLIAQLASTGTHNEIWDLDWVPGSGAKETGQKSGLRGRRREAQAEGKTRSRDGCTGPQAQPRSPGPKEKGSPGPAQPETAQNRRCPEARPSSCEFTSGTTGCTLYEEMKRQIKV